MQKEAMQGVRDHGSGYILWSAECQQITVVMKSRREVGGDITESCISRRLADVCKTLQSPHDCIWPR